MVNLTNVVIETDRLKLVPTSPDFVDVIFKEFTAKITEFMTPKSPLVIKETLDFIKKIPKKNVYWSGVASSNP